MVFLLGHQVAVKGAVGLPHVTWHREAVGVGADSGIEGGGCGCQEPVVAGTETSLADVGHKRLRWEESG